MTFCISVVFKGGVCEYFCMNITTKNYIQRDNIILMVLFLLACWSFGLNGFTQVSNVFCWKKIQYQKDSVSASVCILWFAGTHPGLVPAWYPGSSPHHYKRD